MAALAFWLPWVAVAALVGALMFTAWYGPSQDISNLSRWAWLLGWRRSPGWLRARAADRWMMGGGVLALALLVAAGGFHLFAPVRESSPPLRPMPDVASPFGPSPAPSGRPARQIDGELESAILVHIAKDKTVKVLVLAGDPERDRFADQIEGFLKSQGYRLAPRVSFAGSPPFIGTRLFPDPNDPNVFVIQIGSNDRK